MKNESPAISSDRRSLRTIQLLIAGTAIGIAIGLGAYTFIYAKGGSYLLNDPQACANCHIMNEQYAGWLKSPHRSVATCNDCHTPPGTIAKYLTKASNGFWHSFAFTTGRFHEPIQITKRNHEITESACLKCHAELTSDIRGAHAGQKDTQVSCVRCHRSVGHRH